MGYLPLLVYIILCIDGEETVKFPPRQSFEESMSFHFRKVKVFTERRKGFLIARSYVIALLRLRLEFSPNVEEAFSSQVVT